MERRPRLNPKHQRGLAVSASDEEYGSRPRVLLGHTIPCFHPTAVQQPRQPHLESVRQVLRAPSLQHRDDR